ncbi:helix-turn-helix transcriptional regulator [Haloferula chungangensis]|uniref:Helix-turn-helix transcriptional regulator n=1 Tax=Haloferula chungangensis TaxID=1048331 RepID=A0ABW2L0F7_9BACT
MSSSFHLLSARSLKKARHYLETAATCRDFYSLQQQYLNELPELLPSESSCWDTWAPDRRTVYGLTCPDQWAAAVSPMIDAIQSTIETHPVVRAGEWVSGKHSPARLSDYSSRRQLREIPLYREVYRKVDIEFQILASFGNLPSMSFIVSLNRKSSDFTSEEFQLLDFVSTGMEEIAGLLDRTQTFERLAKRTTSLLSHRSGLSGWSELTLKEIETLGRLASHSSLTNLAANEGVSRYTLNERLASIRNKIGLESTAQLRATLREISGTPSTGRKCGSAESPPGIS